MPSNPLDFVETSMTKFKVTLNKELHQVSEVLFILTGNTYCHIQVLCSYVYSLVSMHHVKVGCLLIVNGGMHLVKEL